jgi:hypothetical protein
MDKNYFVNGHVQLINNTTNEILVDADNLIVNDGRKAIIETLTQAGFFTIYNPKLYDTSSTYTPSYMASLAPNSNDENLYTFKKIVFGYGNDEVLSSDNYNKIKQLYEGDAKGDYWHIDIEKASQVYTPDTRSVEFTITFTGQTVFTNVSSEKFSTAVISELGIVLNKIVKHTQDSNVTYQNTQDVLFSRIKFDAISIVSDNAYTLKYVLYF